MGLDINVLAKPQPGQEAEFEKLWRTLNEADGLLADETRQRGGLLARLFARSKPVDRDALVARFQEISVAPYASLGAPVVGRDEAANAWLRGLFEKGELKGAGTFDEALAQFDGYFAIEAMPDCDGFPVYSNAGLYDGVDRTSFRGEFLERCEGVIGTDLIEQAWVPMLAGDLGSWGAALRAGADRFAADNGLGNVLGDRHAVVDIDGPDGRLHVVDQAARWARFWSERGHGAEPYF